MKRINRTKAEYVLIIVSLIAVAFSGCAGPADATVVSVTAEPVLQETMSDNKDKIFPADSTPPIIVAPQNIFTSAGAAIRYKSYITVTDDSGEEPVISVDNSKVNLAVPGSYTVVYSATDHSGNVSEKTVGVIVKDQTETNFSDEEIYEKADRILEQIISDDMTDLEKVFSVFYYIRDNYGYSPDQKHWSYKQEAYDFMTKMNGSCYGNVSLSKLLLERLGYNSIMVEGSMAIDEETHYWNLVSIDGGLNWYMYDAIWVMSYYEYPVCMVTREFAQAMAYRNDMEYKCEWSAYPEVSKVPLWTWEDYESGRIPLSRYMK